MYKTLDDLRKAILDYTEGYEENEWPNLKEHIEVIKFKRLSEVYFGALNNPPEGVFGVGAIAYAEDMLIAAQGHDN